MGGTGFEVVDIACKNELQPSFQGNFVFKALVKPEQQSWKERFTIGLNPAPDIIAAEQESSGQRPKIFFNRDIYVSQGILPPLPIMSAGTEFVEGLGARQHEMVVGGSFSPLIGSTKFWFGNGCMNWTNAIPLATSGTAIYINSRGTLGGEASITNLESCENGYKIACLAIEN